MQTQTQASERRIVNTEVVTFLLNELDETNFHAVRGTWEHISNLLDCGSEVGDLRSWITAAGAFLECLEYQCGPNLDDSYDGMEHLIYETNMPARILGVSDDELDDMCNLPVGRVREKLAALIGKQQAA